MSFKFISAYRVDAGIVAPAGIALTGVSGTGARGSLGATRSVALTGVAGTAGRGSLTVAGSVFSPSDLGSTLAQWLRADAGVTTVSGDVSAWADQSGAGKNATQGTAGSRPTLTAAALNGKPVITWPSRKQLTHASVLGAGATAFTCFYVIRPTDVTSNPLCYHHAASNIDGGQLGMYACSNVSTLGLSLGFGSFDGTNLRDSNEYPSTTAWKIQVHQPTKLYKNGTETGYDFAQTITGGELTCIGDRPDKPASDFFFIGNIAEVVICDTTLSGANRQKVEGYLAWAWGLQSLLPVGHPYISAPP